MAYVRKTRDEWQIHGWYGSLYGWEEVSVYDSRKEAIVDLRIYRESERGIAFKLIKCRVKIAG
jgi:hypothetical protein